MVVPLSNLRLVYRSVNGIHERSQFQLVEEILSTENSAAAFLNSANVDSITLCEPSTESATSRIRSSNVPSTVFTAEVVARLLVEFLPIFDVDELLQSGKGFRAFAAAVSKKTFRDQTLETFKLIGNIILVSS